MDVWLQTDKNTMIMNAEFPKERPNFGSKQVRTINGIKVGNILVHVSLYGEGFKKRILVISDPYPGNQNFVKFDVLYLDGDKKGWMGSLFAEDAGVVCYYTGVWNPVYCVLRSGRRRLTKEQIHKEIKKLFKPDSCSDLRDQE